MNDRTISLPLSSAQLAIWLANKLDPTDQGYNMGEWLDIRGAIDPTLFAAAIRQAVSDTEALRVRLIQDADGPQQIIDPPSDVSVPLLDLSAEADPQAAAEAWMMRDLAQPVNLLRGPLWNVALFKAAP